MPDIMVLFACLSQCIEPTGTGSVRCRSTCVLDLSNLLNKEYLMERETGLQYS